MASAITVSYRAVHMNTAWRKVRGHTSIENALYGRNDGAPGLFAHRARIDYVKHGEPLYAVIWEDNARFGFVVKKDSSSSDGTAHVKVPIDALLAYDAKGGASTTELEAHFSAPPAEATTASAVPEELADSPMAQAEEGAAYLKEHLARERNVALADAKKRAVLSATGRLACEACRFDFSVAYGEIGTGFCEVHHIKPLGARNGSETTSLRDLAILCSNCHSIIHRTQPMWAVAVLANHIDSRGTRK